MMGNPPTAQVAFVAAGEAEEGCVDVLNAHSSSSLTTDDYSAKAAGVERELIAWSAAYHESSFYGAPFCDVQQKTPHHEHPQFGNTCNY